MKILKKNDVLAQTNRVRQDQIDEAANLVESTETARRALADIKKQHEDYIQGMKATLEAEIEPLVSKKKTLEYEIERDTKILGKLREPLSKEWSEIDKKKLIVGGIEKELNEREQQLVKVEQELEIEREAIKSERKAANELASSAVSEFSKAENKMEEADKAIAEAEKYSLSIKKELDHRQEDVEARELEISLRAVDLEARENNLDEREQELNNRETFINDKYATLERTINRLK